MSPLGRKTAEPKQPRKVEAEGPRGGKQKVEVALSGKHIVVTWICGGSRTFTVEELRRQIAWLDDHGSRFVMWFNNKDSHASGFWVKLHEGKLTANDGMRDNGYVSWANLKRALQAAIVDAHD